MLAVSIDGLNPDALTRLGPSELPSFFRLLDQGASTLNARTEVEQTVTLPNHASMMTGRRIDVADGGHGVTFDEDSPGATVQRAAHEPVDSVFTEVHDAGGSTALFTTKSKFDVYDRSWPLTIDDYDLRNTDDAALASDVSADLRSHDRAFTFLHFGAADVAGHAHGWLSPAYLDAVRHLDGFLGEVLATIDADPDLAQHLVVILTADHGGAGHNHADATALADYRIPFAVWGPGVAQGDLYALNPAYRDPGTSRPTYAGPQPVRNGNVADLATSLLGLPPVPGSQIGVTDPLRVGR